MPKNIVIIGLGEVGSATLDAMIHHISKKRLSFHIYGMDINENLLKSLKNKYKKYKFVEFGKEIPNNAEIYITSVYTTDQVKSVINKVVSINKKRPLVVIESTIAPEFSKQLASIHKKQNSFDLVLFPHRFNPNDKDHYVFNLNRLMAGIDNKSYNRSLNFYKSFMPTKLIIKVPYFIAALSKPMENTYRYIEIAIAEDIKMECDRLGVNFNDLRYAMNTKWNIDLKEARDGIGGKCLPKDTNLMHNLFKKSVMIKTAMDVDKKYRKK